MNDTQAVIKILEGVTELLPKTLNKETAYKVEEGIQNAIIALSDKLEQ